ncbi:hypothetical protein Btru_005394 [Bulinus truncatus]|nr:hypothetical protein Btru_005394 [Bulinus truncatus]
MTLSYSVYLNFSSADVNDTRLPNDINVTFQSEANTFAELNLKRVDHITSNVPIYTIDTDEEGVKIKKEDVQGNENIAFYQDTKNDAVIQVLRLNDSVGQTEKFIITRGKYRQGDDMYSILPAVRSKRQTSEHGDQSDLTSQRYEVMPMKTPTERQTDFMTAPPKFDSFENLRVLSKRFQQGAKSSRRKRQSISTYYVDVTAYLDYTCYSRFLKDALYDEVETLKKIQEYYAFIFSGIDLIYQNFEANNIHLRVNLNKVLIFKSSASFQLFYIYYYSYKVDTMSVLNNFTTFLNSTDGRDFSFPYDHAMLFVGSDLWTVSVDILGLAWVETLCRTDGVSSSVIEDMGDYSAIFTGAHELGHSLAANHDGVNNTCTYADRYLMSPSLSAPTDSTRQHPWRFSNCSVSSIVNYVTTLAFTPAGQTCLSDALSVVGDFPDVSNRLLGQEYPPDKLCQIRYGSSSYDCEIRDTLSDICSLLYCYDPASVYYCYGSPPLSGTSCGCGKVCRQGDCVIDLSVPAKGCDIFSNCTYAMCLDENLIKYCTYTCGYNNGNLSYSSTTTLRTTVKFTTTQSTMTTRPTTTNGNWCYDDINFTKYGLTCQQLYSYGYCFNQDVQTYCCSSCNQETTTFMTTSGNWCYDDINFTKYGLTCQQLYSYGYCFNQDVQTYCCSSCNQETTTFMTTSGNWCYDNVNFSKYGLTCQKLYIYGYCFNQDVQTYCCSSCNQGTTTITTTPTTRSWCTDTYYYLSFGKSCWGAMQEAINMCYMYEVVTSCCASCAERSTNIPGCEYGDKYRSLCSTIKSCDGLEDICCDTCRNGTSIMTTQTTSTQRPPTTTHATHGWCVDSDYSLSSGKSCREAMLEPTNLCDIPEVQVSCCASCSERSTNIPGCEFGDKYRSMCPSLLSCDLNHNVCCETCGRGTSISTDRPTLMLMLVLVSLFHLIMFS